MNESIAFLQNMLDSYDSIEDKLYFLQLQEQQKYHYYCDCGCNFTQEQGKQYHKTWDWILDMLNQLKSQKQLESACELGAIVK